MDTDVKETILSRLTPHDIYGDGLRKNGKGYLTRCPFPNHDDSSPSFQIYSDTMSFHCFGCNTGGSAFDFLMRRDGIDFPSALKVLAGRAGVSLDGAPHPHARLFDVLRAAQRIFSGQLRTDESAMRYLADERQVTPEMLDRFRIGSANGSSIVAALLAEGFSSDEIEEAGLAFRRNGELRDMFRSRIIFPIISRGRVVGFGGRLLSEAEQGPKYLNSPATPVFKKKGILYGLDAAAIREKGFAVLVEGYTDVISCHQHGHRNAVGPLGTALTKEHVHLLQKHTDTVIVVFDGDSAGSRAAERSVKLLFDEKVKGGVVTLPAGDDPDSYLRRGGDLDALIGAAASFGCYLGDRFPATRKMIFNALLFRSSYDAAEYVAHRGAKEDAETLMQINARKLVEKLLAQGRVLCRQKDVEVRKSGDVLALFSRGRFVLWQNASSDVQIQSQDMVSKFVAIKKKHFAARRARSQTSQ